MDIIDCQEITEGEIQCKTNVRTFQQKRPDWVTLITKVTTTEHVKPLVERTIVNGMESRRTKEQLLSQEVEEDVTELPPGVENPNADGLENQTSTTREFEETLPSGVWVKMKR